MYINTFKYTRKDVNCQLCTEYVKKLGCTALRCPWLAERIEAGVVGYANHTLALDELSEEAASIPAVDVCMEQAHDRAEAIHRSVRKVTQIRKHLTDTQFRRVWMYFVDGMTVDEIGAAEGVSHQNISKSIGAAMKKMKKLFPDC